VDYLNERKRFTPEQIAGIMFTKLKQITDTELKTKACDCVIGVRFPINKNPEKKNKSLFF
jgi:molecular chaperone DnaK (HSP70)